MRGFSLVELSIVLVILGLLTGGILTGQTLIRAAELRSVTTEINRYQSAANTFRTKYFALPGDMRNATNFWGEFGDGGTGSCPAASGTGTETCNGDGNGFIEQRNQVAGDISNEIFQFWKQLSNAGLIEGNYTGVSGPNGSDATENRHAVGGLNAPRGKLPQLVYAARHLGEVIATSPFFYEGSYGHVFYIGGEHSTQLPTGTIFSPEEAWSIDTKIDDGRVAQGKIRSPESQTSCGTSSVAANSVYNLTETAQVCSLVMGPIF